jgi:hypothetical protein
MKLKLWGLRGQLLRQRQYARRHLLQVAELEQVGGVETVRFRNAEGPSST